MREKSSAQKFFHRYLHYVTRLHHIKSEAFDRTSRWL